MRANQPTTEKKKPLGGFDNPLIPQPNKPDFLFACIPQITTSSNKTMANWADMLGCSATTSTNDEIWTELFNPRFAHRSKLMWIGLRLHSPGASLRIPFFTTVRVHD